MDTYLSGKRVLVTGACGTVGAELVRQLLARHDVEEVVGFDNNESELFMMEQRFSGTTNVRFFLGDIRDEQKLFRRTQGMNVIFHAAAFKHVILCERSPFEAVQTNILGVQNIIRAACENNVEKVIFTSSDKAVNPTNVMGTSKLMGERLMTAANNNLRGEGPVFVSTRFGNVLGSRGSVIPVFREQIRRGGPVTLTDPHMTRFIMSIREAVQLVIDSAAIAVGGEVIVTKMPAIRIEDLAQVMIRELAPGYGHDAEKVQIRVIGAKAGEKMYEELINSEETRRSLELERYFVVKPAFPCAYRKIRFEYENVVSENVEEPYNSSNQASMKPEALAAFLRTNGLLENITT